MTRLIIRWPILILIGAIVTFATVVVRNGFGGYGFPFAWKTGGCPPPGIEISASCLLAIGRDWLSFAIDILFFTVAGYVLLVAYTKYRGRTETTRQKRPTIPADREPRTGSGRSVEAGRLGLTDVEQLQIM